LTLRMEHDRNTLLSITEDANHGRPLARPDAGLVLNPDLDRPVCRTVGQRGGKALGDVFLKASMRPGAWPGYCGRPVRREKPRKGKASWSLRPPAVADIGTPPLSAWIQRAAGLKRPERQSSTPLVYVSQVRNRLMASAIWSSAPAKDKRRNLCPLSGSKSAPGVVATPISRSIFLAKSKLSLLNRVTSA